MCFVCFFLCLCGTDPTLSPLASFVWFRLVLLFIFLCFSFVGFQTRGFLLAGNLLVTSLPRLQDNKASTVCLLAFRTCTVHLCLFFASRVQSMPLYWCLTSSIFARYFPLNQFLRQRKLPKQKLPPRKNGWMIKPRGVAHALAEPIRSKCRMTRVWHTSVSPAHQAGWPHVLAKWIVKNWTWYPKAQIKWMEMVTRPHYSMGYMSWETLNPTLISVDIYFNGWLAVSGSKLAISLFYTTYKWVITPATHHWSKHIQTFWWLAVSGSRCTNWKSDATKWQCLDTCVFKEARICI